MGNGTGNLALAPVDSNSMIISQNILCVPRSIVLMPIVPVLVCNLISRDRALRKDHSATNHVPPGSSCHDHVALNLRRVTLHKALQLQAVQRYRNNASHAMKRVDISWPSWLGKYVAREGTHAQRRHEVNLTSLHSYPFLISISTALRGLLLRGPVVLVCACFVFTVLTMCFLVCLRGPAQIVCIRVV
jgi:hypothetical protein